MVPEQMSYRNQKVTNAYWSFDSWVMVFNCNLIMFKSFHMVSLRYGFEIYEINLSSNIRVFIPYEANYVSNYFTRLSGSNVWHFIVLQCKWYSTQRLVTNKQGIDTTSIGFIKVLIWNVGNICIYYQILRRWPPMGSDV